jgi:hypothetical protein
VAAIRPDFVACSVHKWLCCPYGMSLVYVAKKWHREWEPLDMHERGRHGSDDATWDTVGQMTVASGYPTAYMNGARSQHALHTLAIVRVGISVHGLPLCLAVGNGNFALTSIGHDLVECCRQIDIPFP